MRSVQWKMAPILAIACLALVACGKKSADNSTGAADPLNANGLNVNSVAVSASTNVSGFAAAPCSGFYHPIPGGLEFDCSSVKIYSSAGGYPVQVSLKAKDKVIFNAGGYDGLQYLLYLSNNTQQGPIAVAANSSQSLSVDYDGMLYLGKSGSGWMSYSGIKVYRCVDGNNNPVSCAI